MSGPLVAPERVLPTLNADGSRNRIRPKLYDGRYFRARRLVGWSLIAAFVAMPFIEVGGHPLILLDLPARQFSLFGRVFLATDGVLLMLLALTVLVGVIWVTAMMGRAWCGWACPQTVYMELLFRPIERLFEGNRAQQLRIDASGPNLRRVLKNVVFLLLAVLLGNLFLAYFVGVERLAEWMQRSPFEHPASFLVMAVTAGLVLFDFGYFREQTCSVICPYARLQSVLVDKQSLILGYDEARGEPRHRGKQRAGLGDCIDCNSCVVACPTGIDIRDGLQLECIACAQCADACDSVMDKLKLPRGLVRYGSQTAFESGRASGLRFKRWRVGLYTALFLGLLSALVTMLLRFEPADVTVLRGLAAPYVLQGEKVRNQIRIKIENRSGHDESYAVELRGADEAQMIAPENPLRVEAGGRRTTTVFVLAPRSSFRGGEHSVFFDVSDGHGFRTEVPYRLVGPLGGGQGASPGGEER